MIHARGDRLLQSRRRQFITKHTMIYNFMKLIQNWFGCREVHICYPHGKHIFRIPSPFVQHIGITAIWSVVKVVGHRLLYFLYPTIMPSRAGNRETIQSRSEVMSRVKRRMASVLLSWLSGSKIRPLHNMLSMIKIPPCRNFSLMTGSESGYASLSMSLKMISNGPWV